MKFASDLFIMLSALIISIAAIAMAAPATNAATRPLDQGPQFVSSDSDFNRYLMKVKKWYQEPELAGDSYKMRPFYPSEKRMDGQFMNDLAGDRFEWKLTRL